MPKGVFKNPKEHARKISKAQTGSGNSMWKGGRRKHSDGYILIYKPKHPYSNNKGCIREHRLVMEKYLGRYLMPNEVVHHLDGDKENNKIDNLILTKLCKHQELAATLWRVILKLGLAKKVLKELQRKD